MNEFYITCKLKNRSIKVQPTFEDHGEIMNGSRTLKV